jgi:hypothetical protein
MWNKFATKKFGETRTELDGYSFASKLESAVYGILKMRLKAGEIDSIQPQDHVYLTNARILSIVDFKCTRPDKTHFWVEAKGYPTDVWRLKKKLWKHYGPGDLEIWIGSYTRPKLDETIKVAP